MSFWARRFAPCFGLVACGLVAAETGDIAELRSELEALKRSYEAKLEALDARLAALEEAPFEETVAEEVPVGSEIEAAPGATSGFSFTGYFRSGFGVTDSGSSAEVFQAPGADAKYRLGNEVDTYLETAFRQDLRSPGEDAFYVQTRLSYSIPENGAAVDSTFSIREVFAEGKGIFHQQPNLAVWAGQRFYDRYDVHINDYYYLDMSGFGAGVTGIDPGIGEIWIAALGGSIDQLESDGSVRAGDTAAKRSLDFRWKDLPAPWGRSMLWASASVIEGETTKEGIAIDDSSGAALGLIHESGGEDANWLNRFAILYGFGPSSNFRSELIPDVENRESPERQSRIEDSWRFRILNNYWWEAGKWALDSLLLWEERDFGAEVDSRSRWASAGIRPVYFFTRNMSLALELGVDHTSVDGGDEGELYKITIAPQLTPDAGFFSRPAIRMFLTYAAWSESFEGQVAPGEFGTDEEGITFGTQVEAWW